MIEHYDTSARRRGAFDPLLASRLVELDELLSEAAGFSERMAANRTVWHAPFGPPETRPVKIFERHVPGPHGSVRVRVYSPVAAGTPRPGLVWMHGGGFQFGDLDMPEADQVARGLAIRAGAVVVSVDYRLVQGGVHFPVPHDDVVAAYQWSRAHANDLGIAPGQLAIGGASAGGNLAAGAALRLRHEGMPPWQALLAYPVMHPECPAPSAPAAACLDRIPPALRFPPEEAARMAEAYAGGPLSMATSYAFPAIARSLAGFPPTYLEYCEFDDLRPSGEAFARQLSAAGVDVELWCVGGVWHGHLNLVGFTPAARSLDRMAARLQAEGPPASRG